LWRFIEDRLMEKIDESASAAVGEAVVPAAGTEGSAPGSPVLRNSPESAKKEGRACPVGARDGSPGRFTKAVALGILLAAVGCALWGIFIGHEPVHGAVAFLGGAYIAARMSGVLKGG